MTLCIEVIRERLFQKKSFSALIVYTDKHFKYEENLFGIFEYPDSAEHKKEHDELIKQVETLNEKFNSGKSSLSIQVMAFLKTWLSEHIETSDKKYSEFLISRGVR